MMPTNETIARTAMGVTAILPWLWNWYVWPAYGPEMTGEVAGPASTLIAALLARVRGGEV